MKKIVIFTLICGILFFSNGCSIKSMALNGVGDALSGDSTVFSSDNDPDLVKDSLPFALKLYESVLDGVPDHKGLTLATAKAFTEYAYAFLQMEADMIDKKDYERATYLRQRALKLYIRGRDYALRGLELNHQGFKELLDKDYKAAIALTNKDDIPLLYWCGSSWVAALTTDKGNMQLLQESTIGAAMVARVLELDETYDEGAAHEFFIAWDGSRSEAMGGSEKRAREHFKRARELNHGTSAGTYLSLATAVSIGKQDVKEFTDLLNKALAIDPDKYPAKRLNNLIYQKRARYLLENINDYFLIDDTGTNQDNPQK